MTSKFSIEPRVAFVSQLLGEINDGTLQIPRFQRTFVWTWEQQRDLLCSVFEGLPIGAILVWSTTLDNIVSYDKIGPYTLDVKKSSGMSKRLYLMDGLQRMTTFYSTLYYPEDVAISDDKVDKITNDELEGDSDLTQSIVYVDLNAVSVNDMFLRKRDVEKSGMSTKSPNFMPISFVFHTKKFVQFTRKIPAEYEQWIDRADEVASAFKNYKVPIVPLESDDQSLVTKSFERINTRGTIMSEAHMLNALSYSDSFDLLERIDYYASEILGDYFADTNEFDIDFVLAVVKLQLDLDIYYKDTDKLATLVNEELLKKAFEGIKRYFLFIRNNFGMDKPSQVPYKLQSFAIAYAFATEPEVSESLIKNWFFISTYTGAFGATARNSSTALMDFRKLIQDGYLDWSLNIVPKSSKWSENISLKSARMKAWALALGLKQEAILNNSILSEFSQNKGRCLKLPVELHGVSKKPGFYFLVSPSAKDFSIKSLSENEMQAHFVSSLMLKYLDEGAFEKFREERELLIYRWEVQEILKPAALELGFESMEYGV